MIKTVSYDPPFLPIYGGGSSPAYGTQPGAVRWNHSLNCLEADAGTYWIQVGTNLHLSLDQESKEAIQWAKEKMKKEREIETLAEQYPMVKDLKEKLDIMVALVKDYN